MQLRLILGVLGVILLIGVANADTLLTYPTIDGYADDTTSSAYATLRGDTGAAAASGSTTTVNAPLIDSASTSPNFHIFRRAILSFDTSTIPDTATINRANFSLYVTAKENGLGSPAYGITGGNLASNTAIAAGDYDGFNSTRYASDIAYASIGTSARNNWSLNAAGLANISKTGYTVIYFRDNWDIDNSAPTYAKSVTTSITWNPVGYTGTANDPYLEVVYSVTPVASFSADVTTGASPLAVGFTDSSSYTPTDWDWYWYANETKSSDLQNPTTTFTVGTYNVRLYAANSVGGDWENKTAYITTANIPVANFTSNVTSGSSPLALQFNDSSTNTPTSWLWNFGDSSGLAPGVVTVINSSFPSDSSVYGSVQVGLPTSGHLIYIYSDRVWRSTDDGASWSLINSTAGLKPYASMVSLSNDHLVVCGGEMYTNKTWRSTDEGVTWTLVNSSSGWTGRHSLALVRTPNNTIILSGGSSGASVTKNDVWVSTDEGNTWVQQTASAEWSPRYNHETTVLSDNTIILVGGSNASTPVTDVWRSTNMGVSWSNMSTTSLLNITTTGGSLLTLSDNSIVYTPAYISAGKDNLWRSVDQGATWTLLNSSVGWPTPPGVAFMPFIESNNTIYQIGGYTPTSTNYRNVSYIRFNSGSTISTLQNPTMTYTGSVGTTYNVSLTATNVGGSNQTTKSAYISITAGEVYPPVASFTTNVSTGTGLTAVSFADTSTNSSTSWSWGAKNLTPGNNTWFVFNNTAQNPVQTFNVGNWSLNLTATNSAGSNVSTQTTWLNVSAAAGSAPVASFTKSATVLRIPKVLTVTDTSTNTPTGWNWSWGDGTANSTTQNPTHQYTKRGIYTINMDASNAFGKGVATAQTVRVVGYENLW